MRSAFKKIHNHPDHQEIAKYKINRLLHFENGNEKRCVLPLDKPAISKSLVRIGTLIGPFMTNSQPADVHRVIAKMLVERIIRELWEMAS